jgi:hypothetical protein
MSSDDKPDIDRLLVLVSNRDQYEWCNPMIERRPFDPRYRQRALEPWRDRNAKGAPNQC